MNIKSVYYVSNGRLTSTFAATGRGELRDAFEGILLPFSISLSL